MPDTVIAWLCHLLPGTVISWIQIMPDTIIAWLCHLLPGTIISWIQITARYCHCLILPLTAWHCHFLNPNNARHYHWLTLPLTVWHCHFPISSYYQTLSLCDSVTYCLEPSMPNSQLLPDTVTGWPCHWLSNTSTCYLTFRTPPTTQSFACSLYHYKASSPWYTASHPVPDKLSGMRLIGLCHRQFEWHCLSWTEAWVAQSE